MDRRACRERLPAARSASIISICAWKLSALDARWTEHLRWLSSMTRKLCTSPVCPGTSRAAFMFASIMVGSASISVHHWRQSAINASR